MSKWGPAVPIFIMLCCVIYLLSLTVCSGSPSRLDQFSEENCGDTPLCRLSELEGPINPKRNPETGQIVSFEIALENKRALALYQQYEVADSDIDAQDAGLISTTIHQFLANLNLPTPYKKRVIVIGHADLSKVFKNFDEYGVCLPTYPNRSFYNLRMDLPNSQASNECLAMLRAHRIASIVQNDGFIRPGDEFIVGIDYDPFMSNTNEQLESQLYRSMPRVARDVLRLKQELNIPNGYTHTDVDNYPQVQEIIQSDRIGYSRRLFPFRSVILIVEACTNQSCT